MDGPRASRPQMPEYGIVGPDEGGGLLPWSWAADRLSAARNYFVATTRPDGRPHAMAVWGVWLDDAFHFSTARSSRKARNIALRPDIVVCPERAEGNEAIVLEGTAGEVADAALLGRIVDAYNAKYDWKVDLEQGPFFTVRPRTVFAFGALGDFTGTATRWTFPPP